MRIKSNGQAPIKRRKNKQEKVRIVIIVAAVILVLISAKVGLDIYKTQQEAQRIEEEKGSLINKKAEKTKKDDLGNEIKEDVTYKILSIYCGNGMATLIDDGTTEILIDCGAENTAEIISPYVEGNLEYFISTCGKDNCIKGYKGVYGTYAVEETIYSAKKGSETYMNFLKDTKNKKPAELQNININDELTLTIYNDESTAMCIVTGNSSDRDRVLIAGNANAAILENNLNAIDNACLSIVTDEALRSSAMKKVLTKAGLTTIALSAENMSTESYQVCSELNLRVYLLKTINTYEFIISNGTLQNEPDFKLAIDISKKANEIANTLAEQKTANEKEAENAESSEASEEDPE